MAAKNDPAAEVLAKAAEEAKAAAAEADEAPVTVPSLSSISSVVVAKFLASDGRLMEVGQRFVYFPKDWPTYPWTLLRPEDTSLEPALKAEYLAAKAEKTAAIDKNNAAVEALRQLAAKVGT